MRALFRVDIKCEPCKQPTTSESTITFAVKLYCCVQYVYVFRQIFIALAQLLLQTSADDVVARASKFNVCLFIFRISLSLSPYSRIVKSNWRNNSLMILLLGVPTKQSGSSTSVQLFELLFRQFVCLSDIFIRHRRSAAAECERWQTKTPKQIVEASGETVFSSTSSNPPHCQSETCISSGIGCYPPLSASTTPTQEREASKYVLNISISSINQLFLWNSK